MKIDKLSKNKFFSSERGFSLLETLIVVGLIAVFALAMYPSILNSLATRELESEAKDVLASLQKAKFQAAKTKLRHRVRFTLNASNMWEYIIEREETAHTWTVMPGVLKKLISPKFAVTVNLPEPDYIVVFTPLGFVSDYDPMKNTVMMQSDKLKQFNRPDQREVHVLAGGSCRYLKTSSE